MRHAECESRQSVAETHDNVSRRCHGRCTIEPNQRARALDHESCESAVEPMTRIALSTNRASLHARAGSQDSTRESRST